MEDENYFDRIRITAKRFKYQTSWWGIELVIIRWRWTGFQLSSQAIRSEHRPATLGTSRDACMSSGPVEVTASDRSPRKDRKTQLWPIKFIGRVAIAGRHVGTRQYQPRDQDFKRMRHIADRNSRARYFYGPLPSTNLVAFLSRLGIPAPLKPVFERIGWDFGYKYNENCIWLHNLEILCLGINKLPLHINNFRVHH